MRSCGKAKVVGEIATDNTINLDVLFEKRKENIRFRYKKEKLKYIMANA